MAFWAAVLIGLAVLVGSCASSYYSEDTARVKVIGKESVAKGSSGHEYRVYTDTETYVVSDSIVKGRFRSSNDYAQLRVGRTYECTKFGFRVPFFSMFENLKECREA